jgi:hypothetical protein
MRRWITIVVVLAAACGRVGFDARAADGSTSDGSTSDGGSDAPTGYAAVVLADHPIAYWRLDDAVATTAVDATGNDHDGTYHGGVTVGVPGALSVAANGGVPDKAATFDGTDGWVSLGSGFALSGVSTYTLEGWMSTTALGGNHYQALGGQLDRSGGGTPTDGVAVEVSPTNASMCAGCATFFRVEGTVSRVAQATYPATTWTHVVATYDGTTLRLYANGSLASSITGGSINAQTVEMRLADDGEGIALLEGALDEVAVYDDALSAARVLAHYQAGTL